MKPGDLIALKPDFRPQASMRNPRVFLILDQDQSGKSKFAHYVVLDQAGIVINIPFSSEFAYEVISEAA